MTDFSNTPQDNDVIEAETLTNPYEKAGFKEKFLNGASWAANSLIGKYCVDFVIPMVIGFSTFAFVAGPKFIEEKHKKIETLKEKAAAEYATTQKVTFIEMNKETKMTEDAGMANSVIVFNDLEKAKAHITEKTDVHDIYPPWWTAAVGIGALFAAGAGTIFGRKKLEYTAEEITDARWDNYYAWERNPTPHKKNSL